MEPVRPKYPFVGIVVEQTGGKICHRFTMRVIKNRLLEMLLVAGLLAIVVLAYAFWGNGA